MRIVINTQDPERLKNHIIRDVENGYLPLWEIRTNMVDDKLLTPTDSQFADKVLLRLTPFIQTHQLIIESRHWRDVPRSSDETIGTILGRFCEVLFVRYLAEMQSFTGRE